MKRFIGLLLSVTVATTLFAAPVQAAVIGGQPPDGTTTGTPDWLCVRQWESGNNYHASASLQAGEIPRYDGGAYQFTKTGWAAFGGLLYAPWPAMATPGQQDAVALRVYQWGKKNLGNGYAPWFAATYCGLAN